eukprot:1171767-Alexandrium_andersonii.AAC.1
MLVDELLGADLAEADQMEVEGDLAAGLAAAFGALAPEAEAAGGGIALAETDAAAASALEAAAAMIDPYALNDSNLLEDVIES